MTAPIVSATVPGLQPDFSPADLAQAFNGMTAAMGALQRQVAELSLRVSAIESPPSSSTFQYGLPGYGGLPPQRPVRELPFSSPAPQITLTTQMATSASPGRMAAQPTSQGVPITEISFPPSPSPVPSLSQIMHGSGSHAPMQSPTSVHHRPSDPEQSAVPRYHKLTFPCYDGAEDPLGWLLKCEQFFRGQQTRAVDWVWLASFHMTGKAQMWYTVLERDAGRPTWDDFSRLCQQRFGPPLSTNHLADLARLPFSSIVEAYLDAFQARLAHAGHLSPYQQA